MKVKITQQEKEMQQIKDAVNGGVKQGKIQKIADDLSMTLEQLHDYYIILPRTYPAWKLVEEVKQNDIKINKI